MENPKYYTKTERIIAQALDEHNKAMMQDYCGFSDYKTVANALVKAGILPEEEHPEHNHFGTEILPETCEVCATY